MTTATHTFHADVFGQDCEVGYHLADVGTDRERIEAIIDHVTAPNGVEILDQINDTEIFGLAHKAVINFRDAKDADAFGVEQI